MSAGQTLRRGQGRMAAWVSSYQFFFADMKDTGVGLEIDSLSTLDHLQTFDSDVSLVGEPEAHQVQHYHSPVVRREVRGDQLWSRIVLRRVKKLRDVKMGSWVILGCLRTWAADLPTRHSPSVNLSTYTISSGLKDLYRAPVYNREVDHSIKNVHRQIRRGLERVTSRQPTWREKDLRSIGRRFSR
jgi:hypothetical protein